MLITYRSSSSFVLCLASAIMLSILAGCGRDQGPERVVVSGMITYQGKPLPEGMIRFMPTATSPVPMAGAPVIDGKYRIDGHGGVPVGTYKIEIEAYRAIGQPAGAAASPIMTRGTPRQQYIPKEFNTESQLQITIVSGSGEIHKDIDID